MALPGSRMAIIVDKIRGSLSPGGRLPGRLPEIAERGAHQPLRKYPPLEVKKKCNF